MKLKEFKIQYALGTIAIDKLQDMAACVDTSKQILTILSTDVNEYIRECVGYNKNTPIKVLAKLAKDEVWSVKFNVADNPTTPIKILNRLMSAKYSDDNHIHQILMVSIASRLFKQSTKNNKGDK